MLFQVNDNRNKEMLLRGEVSHSVFCQHTDAFSSPEETGDISCMSAHMNKIIYTSMCIYMKLQKLV